MGRLDARALLINEPLSSQQFLRYLTLMILSLRKTIWAAEMPNPLFPGMDYLSYRRKGDLSNRTESSSQSPSVPLKSPTFH
jgi:hypothetical protein